MNLDLTADIHLELRKEFGRGKEWAPNLLIGERLLGVLIHHAGEKDSAILLNCAEMAHAASKRLPRKFPTFFLTLAEAVSYSPRAEALRDLEPTVVALHETLGSDWGQFVSAVLRSIDERAAVPA